MAATSFRRNPLIVDLDSPIVAVIFVYSPLTRRSPVSGKLIKVDGRLLKALYDKYGMNFDYEGGKKFAKDSGNDEFGMNYPALIDVLVEHGYGEMVVPNVGERKGYKQVYLSSSIRDLMTYNSRFDWKRAVYWTAVAPLWVIIPVGAGVIAHFIFSTVFRLQAGTAAVLACLTLLVYVALLGFAYAYQDHRKPPVR
jgi:hypothetical protein